MMRGGDVEMWHRIAAGGRFERVAFLSEPTSLHFVAKWRQTGGYRHRTRAVDWCLGPFLDDRLPPVLRVPLDGHATPQAAAWACLSDRPVERVHDIRRALVQFQDGLLWQGRTVAGLVGLRVGSAVGSTIDRLWNAWNWAWSPDTRRTLRDLTERTGPVEQRARADARRDTMRA